MGNFGRESKFYLNFDCMYSCYTNSRPTSFPRFEIPKILRKIERSVSSHCFPILTAVGIFRGPDRVTESRMSESG